MRIARRSEAGVLGRAAHSELVHVERADAHRAGRFELADDDGVPRRGGRIAVAAQNRRSS